MREEVRDIERLLSHMLEAINVLINYKVSIQERMAEL